MYLVTSHEMPNPSQMDGAKTPLFATLDHGKCGNLYGHNFNFTDQIFGKWTEIPLKKFRVN